MQVARGLSNRGIAGRLFLDQATINTYVGHILMKLGGATGYTPSSPTKRECSNPAITPDPANHGDHYAGRSPRAGGQQSRRTRSPRPVSSQLRCGKTPTVQIE